ncbi:Fructosamine/Ketosamine-3-kinase [Schizophyllum amplum]|uniref:protein-ribulosamine 3-kinase n=1 Tax=Schizophyllum amplum TaxID=97359 RepID=A0A550CM79_9AGAR|nr:Fructosamine/Ketosamine-3-kinase [Auriculariopsis ampla]
MPLKSNIPQVLLDNLSRIEPGADFSGSLPRISSSNGKHYFAKVGSSSEAEQFEGEAQSLVALGDGCPELVPKVFAHGAADGRPYFVSEYKNMGSLTEVAGIRLGELMGMKLHRHTSPNGQFGFDVPTHCGATRMENGWYPTWEELYSAKIGELLTALKGSRFSELCSKGEQVRKRECPLSIEPVILHGDLWSGNAGTDKATGEPAIFDPSSFYGHNEFDLAIARVFGGFRPSFYNAYHKHFPKAEPADQYELRMALYEMFHYLNHTVIFGGGYASSALSKMNTLLSAKL